MGENGAGKACLICVVALGALLTVILVPLSFQYVDFTEYGLHYHTISKVIEPTTAYEATRVMGGPSKGFHIYPKTIQFVIFNGTDLKKAIGLKDKIGGSFVCELSMGYKLDKEFIYNIFSTYKSQYEQSYLTNIRAAVRQGAQSYSMYDFVKAGQRSTIEKDLFGIVEKVLRGRYTISKSGSTQSSGNSTEGESFEKCPEGESCDFKGGASLMFFKLGLCNLDPSKEAIILSTEENNILPKITGEEQKLDKIKKDTEIMVEQYAQNLTTLKDLTQKEIDSTVATIEQREKGITEQTNKKVAEIAATSEKSVRVYTADTANQQSKKQIPLSLERQETIRKVNVITQQTKLLEIRKEKTIRTVRANADKNVIKILATSRANATKTQAAALKVAFEGFKTNLTFSPSELNALHWTDFISDHSASNLHFDIQKPTKLQLDGQQNLYFDSLYDPSPARL